MRVGTRVKVIASAEELKKIGIERAKGLEGRVIASYMLDRQRRVDVLFPDGTLWFYAWMLKVVRKKRKWKQEVYS